MHPQADEYPDQIESALEILIERGPEPGGEALAKMTPPLAIASTRRPISKTTATRVFQRDHFVCRYCDGKTIFVPVMELLGDIYPDVFPYAGSGRRNRLTHPAVNARSAVIDHVVPIANGGDFSDGNLVTACNPCNSRKADMRLEVLKWTCHPIADSQWDGLIRYYIPLWHLAGKPRERYHRSWMRGLGLVS